MNNFLKKILSLTILVPFMFGFIFASADVKEEQNLSDYIFYLEFVNNTPRVSSEAKTPYYIIPVSTHAPTLTEGAYRGEIVSGKGALLTTFWFNEPGTIVASLGKSLLDLHVPYFANASKANFYKGNSTKSLFSISLSASSFCNDNNKCDKEVGENYLNCPNDCPAPPKPQDPAGGTVITPTPTEQAVVTPTDSNNNLPGTNEGTTTRTSGEVESKSSVIPLTIGIFLVLFSIMGMIAWKRRAPTDF